MTDIHTAGAVNQDQNAPKETLTKYKNEDVFEDIFEGRQEVDYINGNVPCLGGGCELGNTKEILTDCTGSGCPPRDKTWYEQFIGIPVPTHTYFDRKRKRGEIPVNEEKKLKNNPKKGRSADFDSFGNTFFSKYYDTNMLEKIFGNKFSYGKPTTYKTESSDLHSSMLDGKRSHPYETSGEKMYFQTRAPSELRSAYASTQPDQSPLGALLIANDPIFLHVDRED